MNKQNINMEKNSTPNNPQRRVRMSINEFITPISQNPNRIPAYHEESRRSSASSLGILEIDTLSDIGKDVDFEENFDLKTVLSQKSLGSSSQRAIELRQKMQKALASKAIGEINKKNFDQQFKENIGGDYLFERSNEIPGGNSRINSMSATGIPSYLLRPDDSLELTLTNTPIIPSIEISNNNVGKNKSLHEEKKASFSFSSISLGEFRPAEEAMSLLEEKNWQDAPLLELRDIENKRVSDFSNVFSDDHQISVSSSKLGTDFHNYKGKLSPSKYFRMKSELMIPIENPLSKTLTKDEHYLNTSTDSILSISKISKLVSETSSGNIVDQLLIKSKISPKVLKERSVLDNTQRSQSIGCPCHLKVPSHSRSKSVNSNISPNITIRKSRSVSPNFNYTFHTPFNNRNIEKQFNQTAPSTKLPEWEESCRLSSMSNFSDIVSVADSESEEPWLFITEHEQRIISINEKYIQEYVYFHNMSGRHLKCTIRLDHILGGNGDETIKWPQHTVSFAPFSSKDAKILVSPKVNGHLDLFFKISIQEEATEREQILSHQMKFIISESCSKETSSLASKNSSGTLKNRKSSSSVDSGRSSYMTHPSDTKSAHSTYENTKKSTSRLSRKTSPESSRTTPTKSTSHLSRKTSPGSPRTSTPKSRSSNADRSSFLNNIRENTNKENFKIQATAGEVIWASIPVGSRKTQSIKVRHFGPLCKIQVNIYNDATKSFSVLNDDGEWVTAYHFIQKDKEITSLKFGLMPCTTGQCTADVKIIAILNEKKSSRIIPLFGFGGEAHLILKGLNRDNAGRLSLKLGKLKIMERQRRLVALLHVRNDGSIPGFFAITEIIPELNSISFNALNVTPKTFILPPGFSEDIQIEYKLNMSDIRWISQSKEEKNALATLKVFYGDEPTRRRLCKIFEKYPNKEFPVKLKYLVNNENFSNEFQIPNAYKFNDPWSALSELSLTLKDMQIRLEVERELEEASLLVKAFEKTDGHLTFQTLLPENTHESTFFSEMGPPIAPPINSSLAKRSNKSKPYIEIEPTMLFFSSQIKNSVVILHNISPVQQTYEISSPDSHLFKYNSVGHITPGEKIPIHITSTSTDGGSYKTLISVYVENDRIDIPVTFLPS